MARQVQFQGTVHEFPDGATDDQIRQALMGMQQPTSSTPAPQTPTPDIKQPEGSGIGRFASGLWDTTLGALGKMVVPAIDLAGQGFSGNTVDPFSPGGRAITGLVQSHIDQAQKAKAALDRGDHMEAFGHSLATIIPLLGPAAAHAGERIGGSAPVTDRYGNIVEPGKAPDVAGGLGEATGLIAGASPKNIQAPVLKLAGEAAGKAIPAAAKALPDPARFYQQALNPRVTTPVADVRAMVKTGLENRIPVSEAGQQRLGNLLQDLHQQIQAKVAPAAERGVTVDPHAVAGRLADVEQRVRYQVNPERDIADVKKSGQEFLRSQGESPGQPAGPDQTIGLLDDNRTPITRPGTPAVAPTRAQPIPVDEAQAIKIGTYQKLAGKYGEEAPQAQVEAQKALARGLKEELSNAIPELADLNAKEGSLFDLQGPLETAVNKATQRQVTGKTLQTAGLGVAGNAIAGPPGAAAGAGVGILKQVLSNPAVRSHIAIAINQARRMNPGKFGAPDLASATARVASFANALNQGQNVLQDAAARQAQQTAANKAKLKGEPVPP